LFNGVGPSDRLGGSVIFDNEVENGMLKLFEALEVVVIFPRFGRVPKAEIYSIKIRKGIRNGKNPKSLHARI